ncbi:MAG: protein kinase [Planctomycetes bacterium]|nr:protein kinase [Planctomycetota bacterium]
MHTLSECPTAENLQRLLLGFGDDAFAVELEQHVGTCPVCLERVKSIPAEDEVVRSVKRANGSDDTPIPAAVQTLVRVLRRLHAKTAVVTTAVWTSKDTADIPTVTIDSAKDVLAPSREPGEIGRFGPYSLHEILGAGGMGVVYRGFDSRLQRAVAVKVIRPELLTASGVTERFLAEARAAAAVEHDHIVVVHAVEIHEGTPSLIMPLLKGDTLERQLRDTTRPLAVQVLMRIAQEVASGLAAAHACGLIHRDIKPANLWVEQPGGRLKILDFGLAVVADAESSGGIAGTPGYMAPEQIRGDAVDARADLFSLGCVLYRAATGAMPFPGNTPSGVLVRTLSLEPIPVATANPLILPELTRLIERLLAKAANDRPESADAVLVELAAIDARIAAKRARISRRRWLLGITATGVASGLGMWLFGTPDPVQVEVLAPEVPPVRIEFVTDPEINKVTLTRDGKDLLVDLKSDNAVPLVPGDYHLRSAVETAERKLEPSVITVIPDTPRMVKLALVGEVANTKAHDGAVTGVATLPGKDRFTVLSAGLDRRIQAWIPGMPNPESKLLPSPAQCFAVTPDGLIAVTAGGNKQEPFELGVQLWDATTLQPKGEPLEAHKRQIGAIAISPDARHVISAARNEVFLWDAVRHTHQELEGHGNAKVNAVAFDASGKRAITGDEQGYLFLWDIPGTRLLKKFIAEPLAKVGAVRAVVFTPAGLVASGDDGSVRIWDLTTFKVRELPIQPKSVLSLAVSKDGKRLLSGGDDGSVKLWLLVDGTLIYKFTGHAKRVRGVAFSPNGREAVTGGDDNAIRVWRLPFE